MWMVKLLHSLSHTLIPWNFSTFSLLSSWWTVHIKTKKFGMTLYHILGIINSGRSFSVAFCFLSQEKKNRNMIWTWLNFRRYLKIKNLVWLWQTRNKHLLDQLNQFSPPLIIFSVSGKFSRIFKLISGSTSNLKMNGSYSRNHGIIWSIENLNQAITKTSPNFLWSGILPLLNTFLKTGFL